MVTDEPIGMKIAKRRQQLRLTQEELARRLGVTKATVARWEGGRNYPQRHLGAIESILGVNLTELPDVSHVNLDPDEAEIWNLSRIPEKERRDLISYLRWSRAQKRQDG